MKIKLLALSVILALAGCDDDNSSVQGSQSSLSTFAFIDEPVKGLYYESGTNVGCTDLDGKYKVNKDQPVSFSIGKCDELNQVISGDNNKVEVGFVEKPSSLTTPYDLKINNSTNVVDVNPIAIASILKSLNTSIGDVRLDLSGVKLNENGVDTRAELKGLISEPSKDISTALNSALFTKLQTVNSNINKNFKNSAFVDESTVKSQLSKTIKDYAQPVSFTASDVAESYIVTSNNEVYFFNRDEGDDGSFSAHGIGTKYTYRNGLELTALDFSTWGILSQPFGSNGDVGQLYIAQGTVIERLRSDSNTWLIDKNASSIETWHKGVPVTELSVLIGDYISKTGSKYGFKFNFKFENDEFTLTQTNESKDPNVGMNFTESNVSVAGIVLGKTHVKFSSTPIEYVIIPTSSDGMNIALLAKSTFESNSRYELVDRLTKLK